MRFEGQYYSLQMNNAYDMNSRSIFDKSELKGEPLIHCKDRCASSAIWGVNVFVARLGLLIERLEIQVAFVNGKAIEVCIDHDARKTVRCMVTQRAIDDLLRLGSPAHIGPASVNPPSAYLNWRNGRYFVERSDKHAYAFSSGWHHLI